LDEIVGSAAGRSIERRADASRARILTARL
jgi:hypothetical protein